MYANHITRHVRNLITTAWPEEFYINLRDAAFEYDNVHPRELLKHILANYSRLDDTDIKATLQAIYEAPDFNKPIDVYFNHQEKLQDVLEDAFITVDKDKLVRALQKHAASTGMLNSAYPKWTKNPRPDRSWTEAKKYFREALADVKAINKIRTGETNFGAKAVEEHRMNEVSEIIGQSMDNLALSAVTKQATLGMLAQTNTTLAKANAEQQSTITKLTTKITSLTSKFEQLSAGGSVGNAGRGRFDP